jgi:hypothetical protein
VYHHNESFAGHDVTYDAAASAQAGPANECT